MISLVFPFSLKRVEIKFSTLTLLLLFSFLSNGLQAQNCNCLTNFEWVKKTIEENDAGFAYAIESKGEQAYASHNELFLEKVKSIEDPTACQQTLRDWLAFFRSGHISIRGFQQGNSVGQNVSISDQDIINQFKDWEKLEIDIETFKSYLNSKQEHDFEGIWESPPYKIGIKKEGDAYQGFIMEADGVYWTKGQIKLRIEQAEGKISSTYYMRDHSARNFDQVELLGENYLQMGFITLHRSVPQLEGDPKYDQYFKAMSTNMPYFEVLDNHTTYLRIPSFSGSEKKVIDSVILNNRNKILETQNLIIDLRNNGGGSDASFEKLLPILYTNPIRTVGVEFLSTPLNNQRMLDFINDPSYGFDESGKQWAKESYELLSKKLGQFVSLNETRIRTAEYDTIYQNPQNIGILIHANNGSTTEQFLLAAKQSKKVKLFGTTTVGVLDISNMYFVKSPCAEFELGYSLSKSMRIPEMTIDDKGIQPDFYLDKSIPNYEWVDFVKSTLDEN